MSEVNVKIVNSAPIVVARGDTAEAAAASASAAQASTDAASDLLDQVQDITDDFSPTFYGSLGFPLENGESPDPKGSGRVRFIGSHSTGASPLTSNDVNALWNQAGNSLVLGWDFPVEQYRALNRDTTIIGTTRNGDSTNRGFRLKYTSLGNYTSPTNHSWSFSINGSSNVVAAPGWTCQSASNIPNSVSRVVLHVHHDGSNMSLDVYDIDTATWYLGTPVAKPASWAGVELMTYDLCLGESNDLQDGVFPLDWETGVGGFVPQFIPSPRGSFTDILITDVEMSSGEVEDIYRDGLSPSAVVFGGSNNIRLHCPLVDSGGQVDLNVLSNISSLNGTEATLEGVAIPGPTIKKQGTNYFTLDRLPSPGFCALEQGAEVALTTFTGKTSGLGGNLQYRFVTDQGSTTNWFDCNYELDGLDISMDVPMPTWLTGKFQLQFRFDQHPTVLAVTHSNMQVGYHIVTLSQSEGYYATIKNFSNTGALSGLGGIEIEAEAGTDTVTWVTIDGSVKFSKARPGLLGPQAVNIANYLRRRTSTPFLIAARMINGTSLRSLMDDSDSSRQWADEEIAHQFVLNRNPDGSIPVTAVVKIGWEAGDNIIPYGREVNYPWYRGRAYVGETFPNNIDHYLHDGTFSRNFISVEIPCNRVTDSSGLTDSDSSNEADQRDSQSNWGHILNYRIGPTTTSHKMEGENSAGGIPSGNRTHPENFDWEGDLEMSFSVAEAISLGVGLGTFPGAVHFEEISVDPNDPNSVLVSLGPSRNYPGLGLTDPDTGYSRDEIPFSNPTGYKLRTKKQGGDPRWAFETKRTSGDSWSITNHVSATIVGSDQVRITFSSPVVLGETSIRHRPGSGGNYSSGVVSQENWRSGQLYFSGSYFEEGKEPGFEVRGSNFELVA